MNLDDLTLFTVTYNNNILTSMMIKSFIKQMNYIPNVVIFDNGNKLKADTFKEGFTIIDNFNYKILSDEQQASKNHCNSIDYALKHNIKTKWVLLVDNDVLFYPTIRKFLYELDDKTFDVCGEIGWDILPPNRLYPYFCLINVEKFNKENINYYDKDRIMHSEKYKNTIRTIYDTGYSFYEDIKYSWIIKEIKISEYCNHLKGAMLRNKNIYKWLQQNKELFI